MTSFEAYRKDQNSKDMTTQIDWKTIISWCKENITIRNVLRVSIISLMISLFLASVSPTGYLFNIRYLDVAIGCLANIIICVTWIAGKTMWEEEQKEREEVNERRRNRIRY